MSNETLSLASTTDITANQILAVGCGSANSPTYTFKDNATMGMYCASSSPSTLGFSVDGQVRCTMTANEVSANVPLKFSDVTAPTPSISTEGYLYKKSGQDKLFWQTTTSGELDLTTAAADNLGNHIATQQLQLLLGSVTAPSLTFQGDLNTGLFSEGADRLSFAIGGTKLAGFTTTGLGIGTDTPAVPLEVSGTIQGTSITDGTATLTTGSITGLVNTTASGIIQGGSFTDGTATLTTGSITGLVNATASGTVQGATLTGTTLTDGTATLTAGSITGLVNATASGTIQGGTVQDSTGTAKLSGGIVSGTFVNGSIVTATNYFNGGTVYADIGSTALPGITFNGGGGNEGNGLSLPITNEVAFSTGGTERMRLTSAGLGIGLTNHTLPLQIEYQSGGTQLGLNRADGNPSGYLYMDSSNYLNIVCNSGGGNLKLYTNNSSGTNGIQFLNVFSGTRWFYSNETATQLESGDFGIGGTPNYNFHVLKTNVGASAAIEAATDNYNSEFRIIGRSWNSYSAQLHIQNEYVHSAPRGTGLTISTIDADEAGAYRNWAMGFKYNNSAQLCFGYSTTDADITALDNPFIRIDNNGRLNLTFAQPEITWNPTANSEIARLVFHSAGSADSRGGIYYYYSSASPSDQMQFRTAGNNTRMAIASNGYVGIGTTNPSSLFHITGNTITATFEGTNGTVDTNTCDVKLLSNWSREGGLRWENSNTSDQWLLGRRYGGGSQIPHLYLWHYDAAGALWKENCAFLNDQSTAFQGVVRSWTDNLYDLGTTSHRWRNIYLNSVNQYEPLIGGANGQLTSLGSAGSTGQILTSGGPSANPSWQNPQKFAQIHRIYDTGYNMPLTAGVWTRISMVSTLNYTNDTTYFDITSVSSSIKILVSGTYMVSYAFNVGRINTGAYFITATIYRTPSGGTAAELDIDFRTRHIGSATAYEWTTMHNIAAVSLSANDIIALYCNSDGTVNWETTSGYVQAIYIGP